MLRSVLRRTPAVARTSSVLRSAPSALAKRSLCADAGDGVEVDMVCRVWSGKVKDDAGAHALDCQFEDWLDAVAEVDGCAGASRLLCKTGNRRFVIAPLSALAPVPPRLCVCSCPSLTLLFPHACAEWDYKMILKFDDIDSLKSYMADHHDTISEKHMPKLEAFLADGKFHQQNFVYDDIE
jgi:hypothetical protein